MLDIRTQLKSTIVKLTRVQSGIADLIEQHVVTCNLTKAEKSILWLLVKGFSVNEISEFRSVSSKTIHHLTASIFKKSGVKSRHELMGIFLDD